MDNTLDLLLKAEVPNAPKKQMKQIRLSDLCGSDVLFDIQALTYSQERDIEKEHGEDMNVFIVLTGVKSPNLKDPDLMKKYGVPTPAELVKKMFLPGEIVDLSREIEKLSGFRTETLSEVEEIKKK